MAQPLPRLRMNLDFIPSPVEDRPGLLIRDSFYSDVNLIIPPPLVACLSLFDGVQTRLDLKSALVQLTGDLDVSALEEHLVSALSNAGFLHDDVYEQMREQCHQQFAGAPRREATHAGSAYPAEENEARSVLAGYLNGSAPVSNGDLVAIAAPHVSPFGGYKSYCAAYGALNSSYADRVFVVLGTSHYGEGDRFGLTRKNFVTPYGEARTEQRLVDELAQEPAAKMEDYCHSIEHSIEFQVLFLQHLYGPDIRILPVLCGSYAQSMKNGGLPEDSDSVRSFLDRLGEMHAREGRKLLWVLGIDMAHMGARYGDGFEARADEGRMLAVAEHDRARIDRMSAGDAHGFWELVRENEDDLKWCGSSPVYTFLRSVPGARGELRRYEQWNIDEQSVVSFAGMTFD